MGDNESSGGTSDSSWGPGPTDTVNDASTVSDTADGEPVSFFQRLMQSLIAVLIGLLLLGGSIAGIFWNENRAVQEARALDEGLHVTIEARADQLDPANQGKLVHISGAMSSASGVRDDRLAVSAPAVRMTRHVEMYQWREEQKTENNRTVYSYSRVWSSTAVSSSGFRDAANHRNPSMPLSDQSYLATDAMIGAYRLSQDALNAFQPRSEVSFEPNNATVSAIGQGLRRPTRLVDKTIVVGNDPDNPQIGDLKISFRIVPVGPASIAARQMGSELTAYTARNGRTVLLAQTGTLSTEAMFAQGQADNRVLTWILRAVTLAAMFIGFMLIASPFTTLASYIPFIADILAAGVAILALVLTILLGTTVTAIAWFVVRPILTIALIVGGVGVLMLVKWLTNGRAAANAAARQQAQRAPQPALGQVAAPPPGTFGNPTWMR